jgi:hypothetical protein
MLILELIDSGAWNIFLPIVESSPMTVMIETSTTNVMLWDLAPAPAALVKDADTKKLRFIEEMTSKVDIM